MRLFRADLLPIMVIIAGGTGGVVASGGLLLLSRAGDVRPPARVAASATVQGSATEVVLADRASGDGLLLVPVAAVAEVEELLRLQREVAREVRELPRARAQRMDRIEQLREQKDRMVVAVRNLELDLDRFASSGWPGELESGVPTSRAADHIRKSKLREKLEYSRGTIEQWEPQSAVTLELSIESDLQAIRGQMERVPLIYVQGMRIETDGGTSVFWDRVVRGEEGGIPMSVLRSAIDSWREATATPASLVGGIESLEVVRGDAAIASYGEEASNGVIQIFLEDPEPPSGK